MLPDGVLAVIKDPAHWVQGLRGSLLACYCTFLQLFLLFLCYERP